MESLCGKTLFWKKLRWVNRKIKELHRGIAGKLK